MSIPIADDFAAVAAGMREDTPATPKIEWALGDIEPALFELRANIGILGHLATAEGDVTQDQWQYVESNLIGIHARLDALWQAMFDQWGAERLVHKEALAAANAQTAWLT